MTHMDIYQKLTKEEQEAILGPLFGFFFDGDVLVDENEEPFYGIASNKDYDLSTMRGIFDYTRRVGVKEGEKELQRKLQVALGIGYLGR